MKRLSIPFLIYAISSCVIFSEGSSSQPDEVDLTTKMGRTFRGVLNGIENNQLSLKIITPQNEEIIYRFSPAEVKNLSFTDQESEIIIDELLFLGNEPAAISLLKDITEKRLPYLPFLKSSQQEIFLTLTRLYLESSQEARALNLAETLLPSTTDPVAKRFLRDAILQCHFQLGKNAATYALAKQWCQETSLPTPSALGWKILASLAYDEERWEEAIWIALQPITFSSYLPTDYLPDCYAIAIASCHEIGDTEKAKTLFNEMVDQSLQWPGDIRFLALYSHYESLRKEALLQINKSQENAISEKSPEKELNLSLDEVRKFRLLL